MIDIPTINFLVDDSFNGFSYKLRESISVIYFVVLIDKKALLEKIWNSFNTNAYQILIIICSGEHSI